MAEQFERLARPSSGLDSPGISSARGVNRNHLTLYLSVAALVLSLGGIAVEGFIFWKIDWQKKIAETELFQVQKTKEEAFARAAQLDVALKAQQIKTSAAQEQEALAAKINHIASARNNDQDTAKKRAETETAVAQGYLNTEVVLKSGIVPMLAQSARGTVKGDADLLGVPRLNSVGPPPIVTGVPITTRARGNLGPEPRPLDRPDSVWGVKESTAK